MKAKYLVVDNYELDMEVLGRANTMEEVEAIAKQRVVDTDTECYVLVLTLNPKTNKYSRNSAELVRVPDIYAD